MQDLTDRIKRDSEERVLRNNDGNPDFLLYLDNRVFQKGEAIDCVNTRIEIDQPTLAVFVDDEPGKNFGHRCHYLLYNAETGEFVRKISAQFPHFFRETPDTLDLFRASPSSHPLYRKKKIRTRLDVGRLSAYRRLAPFPLNFCFQGTRFAILFSGASNGRHVNDLEFLYRTLVDVYGYNTANIYVLNHDGTVNYTPAVWPSGWTEPLPSSGFGPDGSAWRMVVNGRGDRAGFQSVISNLQSRMGSWDCLFIHTNNHGWYDANGGFMSAYSGVYYASDFAADLAALPQFKTLLVTMEQCASGSFATPILNNTPATDTVFQAAVPGNESSAGGWPFDPWAEMWISAMAGVRGDGSALSVSPDDNLDTLISAWEAYDYAVHIDNPVMSESSTDLSRKVFLCRCGISVKPLKEWKEPKEFKEIKEWKEPKEIKDPKDVKEWKEPKEVLEPKQYMEPKQLSDPKQYMEPKQQLEGPQKYTEGFEARVPLEQFQRAYYELEDRLGRLEQLVNKLKPFIEDEERPDVNARGRRRKK